MIIKKYFKTSENIHKYIHSPFRVNSTFEPFQLGKDWGNQGEHLKIIIYDIMKHAIAKYADIHSQQLNIS